MLGAMLRAQVSLLTAIAVRQTEELVITAGPCDDFLALAVKKSDFNAGGAFKPVLETPYRQMRMKMRAPYGALKNRKYR